MRAITIAIPALVLVSFAAAAQDRGRAPSGPALAPPASATGQATTPQAPVGHRQPTQSTLPPAVRSEEDSRRQPADPLGPVPKICSNC
ncbi:MAG TPA: hypothetical protein VKG24_16955 [Pseudolabrys sp.]|nr:hypothetical protein [Pseudolabrys sp.]